MSNHDPVDIEKLTSSLLGLKEIMLEDPKRAKRDPSILGPIDQAVALAVAYDAFQTQTREMMEEMKNNNVNLNGTMEEVVKIQQEFQSYRTLIEERGNHVKEMEGRLTDSATRIHEIEEKEKYLVQKEESLNEKDERLRKLEEDFKRFMEHNTGLLDSTSTNAENMETLE